MSRGAGEQGSRGAGEQGSRGAGEQGSRGAGEQGSRGAGEQKEKDENHCKIQLISEGALAECQGRGRCEQGVQRASG